MVRFLLDSGHSRPGFIDELENIGTAGVLGMKPQGITQLLVRWSDGDKGALDELMPLVYDELHKLAYLYLRRERNNHTLQPTALVNEAYVKLVQQENLG